jgi:hypothetical protein
MQLQAIGTSPGLPGLRFLWLLPIDFRCRNFCVLGRKAVLLHAVKHKKKDIQNKS